MNDGLSNWLLAVRWMRARLVAQEYEGLIVPGMMQ